MGTLQQRVQEAIDAGFTNGQLAKAAGVTTGAVSQWTSGGTKSLKAKNAAGLEKLTGWSASWWATGKPPKGVGGVEQGGQAHPMRHAADRFDAPVISIESLMSGAEVGEFFQTEIEDDAMAPDFSRGTRILWSSSRQAKPGRLVLVRDLHGAIHVRECRQGSMPGVWLAAPRNAAFATLDSAAHELQIIGVKLGVIDPED